MRSPALNAPTTQTTRPLLAILSAMVVVVAIAGCTYAPLSPSTSAVDAQTGPSVPSGGVNSTGAGSRGLKGQVCCVAADSTAPTVVGGVSVAYNGWDTAFISWMVPHFAVASQLAELAPSRARSAGVKTLASTVDAASSPTYVKMAAMATAWGQPVPSTDPAAASGHDHGGDAGSGADTADSLTKLAGRAFDTRYLASFIAESKAALRIAEATVANCTNPQAKRLAQEIVTDATAQIAQAEQLFKEVA